MKTLSEVFNGKIPGLKQKTDPELGQKVVNKILTNAPNTRPSSKVPVMRFNSRPTTQSPFRSMDSKIYGNVKKDINFNLMPNTPKTQIVQKANMGFNMAVNYKQDFFNKANMRPDLSAKRRMNQQRGLSLFGDRDGDRLPNVFDCDPLDPNKQGKIHDFFSGIGSGIKQGASYVGGKLKEGAEYAEEKFKDALTYGADDTPDDYLERYEDEDTSEGVSEYTTSQKISTKMPKIKTYKTTAEEPDDVFNYDIKSKIDGKQKAKVKDVKSTFEGQSFDVKYDTSGVVDETPTTESTPKESLLHKGVMSFARGLHIIPTEEEKKQQEYKDSLIQEARKELIDEVKKGKFKSEMLGLALPKSTIIEKIQKDKDGKTIVTRQIQSQDTNRFLLGGDTRTKDLIGGLKAGFQEIAGAVRPETIKMGTAFSGGQPTRLEKMAGLASPATKFKSQVIRALGKKEDIEKLETREKQEKLQEQLLEQQLMQQQLYQQGQVYQTPYGAPVKATYNESKSLLIPDTPPPGMPATKIDPETGRTLIWSNATQYYVINKRGRYKKRRKIKQPSVTEDYY